MVTVIVGEKGDSYTIQKALLTNASKWFVSALNERFTEGKELTLRFPDTEPEVIQYFFYFLIRGTAPLNALSNNSGKDKHNQLLAVRIWAFGDKHFLPGLQNKAMKHLFECFGYGNTNQYPEIATVSEAFATSRNASTMRRFMMILLVAGLRCKYRMATAGYTTAEIEVLEGIPGLVGHLANELASSAPNPNSRSQHQAAEFLVPE